MTVLILIKIVHIIKVLIITTSERVCYWDQVYSDCHSVVRGNVAYKRRQFFAAMFFKVHKVLREYYMGNMMKRFYFPSTYCSQCEGKK